ncbi:unnamed protein product [Eruca vesicaria subsp. sativa]|uniref:SANTA domain-containing protein n=1 Tax=Eruca vesicaria subsp. sativa TaxID=29727 RepID=A0ABC8L2I2_ERUVS|nr:unnamed protein product [Eruca vesicaria subsp. sativa]
MGVTGVKKNTISRASPAEVLKNPNFFNSDAKKTISHFDRETILSSSSMAEESSSFQKTVVLRDWWLIKCEKEYEGKRFGVAGTQITETRTMRVFTSSPIITVFDVFTLHASDGVCIILRGFLNKQRLAQSGFLPQISREFIFGFPPCWESKCNDCFVGVPSGDAINKASSRAVLSPCKWNVEDSPAVVVEKNTEEEIVDKDGLRGGGGSTVRDEKPTRKKSLRLQSKSVEASKLKKINGSDGLSKEAKSCVVEEGESEVNKCTNGGDHVNEGSGKAKNSDVKKVISLADGCGKKHTGTDNVDKVTCMSAVEESLTLEQGKGELEARKACTRSLFEDFEKSGKPGKKAVSQKSGRILRSAGNVVVVEHSGTKVKTAKNKRKHDVSEVQDPTTKDVVEHVNHSRTKVKRKHDVSEVKDPTTKDVGHGSEGLNKAKANDVQRDECMDNEEIPRVDDGCGKLHSGTNSKKITRKKATVTSEQRKGKLTVTKTSLRSLSKEVSDGSKPGKNGKSKKSEKIHKVDLDGVVEPMTRSGSKVINNLSVGKTIRKIDFDEEATPDKDAKKQKISPVSTDSLGQRRSRSGSVLVSPLEFWRNQVPVYDGNRNFIQVNEGNETNCTPPSKGKGSASRKPTR